MQVERSDDVERTEEERGEDQEPEGAEQANISPAERRERLWLGRDAWAGRDPPPEREARDADPDERRPDPGERRDRPDHGPEQRSEDGGAHGCSDDRPTTLRRRRADDPGERAGPRERAADSLREARRAERPLVAGHAEAEARDGGQRHAEEDGPLGPEA
jgi:hypothetical protein